MIRMIQISEKENRLKIIPLNPFGFFNKRDVEA